MISSGTISVCIGMLPAMKITEPYSPSARANASAKPVSSAGISAGAITSMKVCKRVAPSVAAASSSSWSRSSSTGCTVRTTNGRPMKVSATTTPSGVKATLIPSGARYRPIQPLLGVDRRQRDAGDRSRQRERQIDQRIDQRLAGKSIAHQAHATMKPKTELINAPAIEAPKLSSVGRQHARTSTAAQN